MNAEALLLGDFVVPQDVPLADLTAELTTALGDPDPRVREQVAVPALVTWIGRGIYDDLLRGLGEGMVEGLRVGLHGPGGGEHSVLRRATSAEVLTACIARDAERPLVAGGSVLAWGDALAGWLLAETDLRVELPEHGRADAVVRGADAVAALARSPHLMGPELTVLLDVVGERLTRPGATAFTGAEADHLAAAALDVVRREKLPVDLMEAWLRRIADTDEPAHRHNVTGFLRALHLQLLLGQRPPSVRADLLLVLIDVLRDLNPAFLGPAQGAQ